MKGARERSPLLRWHWLAALIVLLLNDRVLKHSALLPGWLTGKLSDFAGLYVAPVALASLFALLSGRRSSNHLTLSVLLTSLGFSLLQLSEPFARALERLTAAVGLPWVVTCDPSDLIALVAAVACVVVFRESFAASHPPIQAGGLHRALERGVLAVALFACAASSDPDDGFTDGGTSDQPALVNGSETETVEVRAQMLRQDIQIDCEAIAEDPGRRLPRTAFASARRFVLEPLQIAPFDRLALTNFGAECFAVMLQLDGREPRVVFWQPGDIDERRLLRTARSIPSRGEGVILVDYDDELIPEQFRDLDGNLLHALEPDADVEPECLASSEQWEVLAGDFLLNTFAHVDSIRRSLDGCYRLELSAAPVTAPNEGLVGSRAPTDSFVSVEGWFEQSTALDSGVSDTGEGDAGADAGSGGAGVEFDDAGAVGTDVDPDTDEDDSNEEVRTGEAGARGERDSWDAGTMAENLVDAAPGAVLEPPLEPTSNEPVDVEADPPIDNGGGMAANSSGPTTAARAPGGPSVLNLCVPDEAFPFDEGDVVQLGGSAAALQMTNESNTARLTLFQRLSVGRYVSGGVEISGAERFGCGFRTRDNPPATERVARLAVESAWGQFDVDVGESHTIEEDGTRLLVGLSAARQQVLGESLGITYSGYMLRETVQP